MKKNYIAPSTQAFAIETSSMIAATLNVDPNAAKVDNTAALGNEGDMWGDASGSAWGDADEEEE